MFEFIDVQGFAGGYSMGVTQGGGVLVAKREKRQGFGVPMMEVNRHLLGNRWTAQCADPEEWEPVTVPVLIANPPCSGFSTMTSARSRGVNAKVNECMYDTMKFAARCRGADGGPGPEIVAMESVQQAFTQGLGLMRALRGVLEEGTGQSYTMTHVLHSNIAVGGCALRRRYMLVLHRVPFRVDPPEARPSWAALPTMLDVIGDLQGLDLTWDDQVYVRPPQDHWVTPRRRADGLVDGHITLANPHAQRVVELLNHGLMRVGDTWQDAVRAADESRIPVSQYFQERLPAWRLKDYFVGHTAPIRYGPDKRVPTITGGAMYTVVHWSENRLLTHRECSRIMGFPDDWRLADLRRIGSLQLYHGKGVTVDVGKWFGRWYDRTLHGQLGSQQPLSIGEREFLYDHTYAHTGVTEPRPAVLKRIAA